MKSFELNELEFQTEKNRNTENAKKIITKKRRKSLSEHLRNMRRRNYK